MGFEDIKVDGLTVDNLKKEIEQFNNQYFGESGLAYLNGNSKKGQLEKYTEAKKKYLEQEFSKVKEYFLSLRWDYTENGDNRTFRANSKVYVSYRYNPYNVYYTIDFNNENGVYKQYAVDLESDFKENPYYRLDTNSKGYGRKYSPIGGEATQPETIKQRLEEIKAVIEHNDSLKGKYNFKIVVDKESNNYHRYEADIERKEYSSIMDIIKEISEEYF